MLYLLNDLQNMDYEINKESNETRCGTIKKKKRKYRIIGKLDENVACWQHRANDRYLWKDNFGVI